MQIDLPGVLGVGESTCHVDEDLYAFPALRLGARDAHGFTSDGAGASWGSLGAAPTNTLVVTTDLCLQVSSGTDSDAIWEPWYTLPLRERGSIPGGFLPGEGDQVIPEFLFQPLAGGPFHATRLCPSGLLITTAHEVTHVDLLMDRQVTFTAQGVVRLKASLGVRADQIVSVAEAFDPVDTSVPSDFLLAGHATCPAAGTLVGRREIVVSVRTTSVVCWVRDVSSPSSEIRPLWQADPLSGFQWRWAVLLPNGDIVATQVAEGRFAFTRFPVDSTEARVTIEAPVGLSATGGTAQVYHTGDTLFAVTDKALLRVRAEEGRFTAGARVEVLAGARGVNLGLDVPDTLDPPGVSGVFAQVVASGTTVALVAWVQNDQESGTLLTLYDVEARRALWRRFYPSERNFICLSPRRLNGAETVYPGTTQSPMPGQGPA